MTWRARAIVLLRNQLANYPTLVPCTHQNKYINMHISICMYKHWPKFVSACARLRRDIEGRFGALRRRLDQKLATLSHSRLNLQELFEMYFQSRRLFLGIDVIGSFMTRDVFVVAPSVLTSESKESVNFVDECMGKFSTGSRDRCPCELHAGEFALRWSLENQEINACNKWSVYQHPVLGQQQETHVSIGYLFSLRQDK